jgi:hypothetical protein
MTETNSEEYGLNTAWPQKATPKRNTNSVRIAKAPPLK